MLGKILNNSALVLLLVFLSSSIVLPELPVDVENGGLEVSGRIKNEKKKSLDSALVTIMDSTGRKVLDEIYTDQKGKFSVKLDYNQFVRMYFSHEGYVTMFGTFDTKVPNSKSHKTLFYEAAIVLLDDSSNFNKQTAKIEPFIKVAYNSGFEIFIEDLDHTFAFLDQVTEPNIGNLTLSGVVQDTTADSLNVKLEVIDSLGRVLAETTTDYKGNYKIEAPIMSKSKLKLISDDHHPSSAEIVGLVPENKQEEFFTMKHNFILIPEEEKITESVKSLSEDKISFDPTMGSFTADTMTRKNYEYAVAVSKRRLRLGGALSDPKGGKVVPMEIEVLDGDAMYANYKVDSPRYEIEVPYQSMVHINYKAEGYHPVFVSLNTNMGFDEMDKVTEFNVPLEMFSKDDTDVNPDAFELPVKKFYYDEQVGTFKLDTSAQKEFDKTLKEDDGQILDTAVSNGFLVLEAKVFDPATRDKISDGRVRILNENKAVVSSVSTDKKGRFNTKLGLNKVYYVELEKEGYYPTLVKFDTKVPTGMENKDINQVGFMAPIVHKENEINGKSIPPSLIENKSVTAFYYDPEEDAFIEDMDVYNAFMESVMNYEPPKPKAPTPPRDTIKKLEPILPTSLALNGQATDRLQNPIDGLVIEFLKDGKKVGEAETAEDGTFKTDLPLDENLVAELSKKGYHKSKVAISTAVNDKNGIKDKQLSLPPLVMYKEDDLNANADAFALNERSFVYNEETGEFESNKSVEQQFEKALAVVPNNQKLAIEGKTKDANGKTIGSTMIKVYEGATLIDSVRSDERGNYELLLPYQKDYRVVVEDDGYYRSYAAVSTKTANSDERLVDKKVKGLDLVIVNRKEEKVNKMAFLKPFSRVKYDASKNEFVEVDEVEEDFRENLFIKEQPVEKEKKPKKEKEEKKKKSVNLESKRIASKQIIAAPASNEYIPPTSSSTTAAKQRKDQIMTNKNLAVKSELMSDFHNMMKGVQGAKVQSMRDVNLDMQRIINTGYSVSKPEKDVVNENMLKALETRQMLNQIVAEALGFRRTDVPPVSTDSIFDFELSYKIEHSDLGKGVYVVSKDRVLHKNQITDYIKETEWWFFDDYYKNGEPISEKEYEKELAALKQNAAVIRQMN